MTPANPWPPGLLALADAGELDAGAPIAMGRVGNTIERVRLLDGSLAVLKRGRDAASDADVRGEAERLSWLDGRAGAPRLLWAGDFNGHAASLVTLLPGQPAHERVDDPAHVITRAARALRAVHALPIEACPFGERSGPADAVIHGDYALPNVLIDGEVVGIVDWSLLRVGDREEDIDDAQRSIRRNFGERWVTGFRRAYGCGA